MLGTTSTGDVVVRRTKCLTQSLVGKSGRSRPRIVMRIDEIDEGSLQPAMTNEQDD